MIMGGSYTNLTKSTGTIIVADTSATVTTSFAFDEASAEWGIRNIRKIDANNTLIAGVSYRFPTSALIAKINHNTGVISFCKYFSSTVAFGNAFIGSDAVTLSNGDFALTGNINENLSSTPCPSQMCAAPVAYGYLKGNFGSNSYGRGDDIGLVRTNGNGDSLWVKKYNLAYDGNGTFVYCPFPAWGADSSRADFPNKLIAVGTDIFITGYTIDYSRACAGNNTDQQAFVMKVNSSGVMQWCKTFFLGTFPAAEYGVDLAAVTSDASNDIVVVMRSENSGNVELFRIQNATGNIVWAKSLGCGAYARGWGIKEAPNGDFIVSITSSIGAIGSYDEIILKIDRNGNYLSSRGVGTVNMDGADSWGWYGPNADVFSAGTFAIAGVTEYSGGNNAKSYVVKIGNQTFSSGCSSHEFNPTITVTNRNTGGANQLRSRTPLVYETRGGAGTGALTLTASTFTTTAINLCLLPVELLDFSAEWKEKNSVHTYWQTASEKDNDYFEIQRNDGMMEDWNIVGKIKGAGNSSTIHNYEFIDPLFNYPPLKGGEPAGEGVLYYRLRQTDFDGKFSYSPIVSVQYNGNESYEIYTDNTDESAKISFSLDHKQNFSLKFFDALGKEIFSKEVSGEKGFNIISIPLSGFTNGLYIASFSSSLRTINKKFIVDFKK